MRKEYNGPTHRAVEYLAQLLNKLEAGELGILGCQIEEDRTPYIGRAPYPDTSCVWDGRSDIIISIKAIGRG